jgi:hypothetical protein
LLESCSNGSLLGTGEGGREGDHLQATHAPAPRRRRENNFDGCEFGLCRQSASQRSKLRHDLNSVCSAHASSSPSCGIEPRGTSSRGAWRQVGWRYPQGPTCADRRVGAQPLPPPVAQPPTFPAHADHGHWAARDGHIAGGAGLGPGVAQPASHKVAQPAARNVPSRAARASCTSRVGGGGGGGGVGRSLRRRKLGGRDASGGGGGGDLLARWGWRRRSRGRAVGRQPAGLVRGSHSGRGRPRRAQR